MEKPKISVITASYNSESTIEQAIKSVAEQTYKDIEYIVIDGCSKDKTKGILEAYLDFITLMVSEPDNGIYDAFNKGIKKSSGEIIYFLNSDDMLYDQHVLEDVANLFYEQPHIKFLCAKVLAREIKTDFSYKMGKHMTLEDFKSGQTYPHQGFFARKELFERYNGFDMQYKLAADLDFMIKCFEDSSNSYQFLDRLVAVFRLGGASNSSSGRQQTINEVDSILRLHFGVNDRTKAPVLEEDLNVLYKTWLEKKLLDKRGLSSVLNEKHIHKIAIFGAMKTGLYLFEDCRDGGVETLTFLDNNQAMHNELLRGVPVNSPEWLREYHTQVDGIVISVEGPRDDAIRKQISELVENPEMKVYTWKELIALL